jgi:hypothetical protein
MLYLFLFPPAATCRKSNIGFSGPDSPGFGEAFSEFDGAD